MDPALFSDCGPARTAADPAGATGAQWGCEDQEGSRTKLRDMDSKCHSVYDSGCIDSGFLSGANLSSEHFVSEEIKSRSGSDTESDAPTKAAASESKSYVRLDSGVDVGLNEQFSSLSLKSINDLNEPSSKCQDTSSLLSNVNVPRIDETTVLAKSSDKVDIPPAPWELYYQQDDDGDTQLHIAVIQGFIEVVYSLIRMAPSPCFLDIRNDVCQTALHLAVLTRQAGVVRRLVAAGAAVSQRDRHGNTPLHLASEAGDLDCLRALLEHHHHHHPDLEERNYDGLMCVHLAAMNGHVEVLRHLVWFGANINATEAKSGRTVLHLAIEQRQLQVLQLVLEDSQLHGQLHLDATTYAGLTAYQLAACVDGSLAESLLSRGAQPRAFPDQEGSSDEDDLEEMYRNYHGNYFQQLKINGDPINASA